MTRKDGGTAFPMQDLQAIHAYAQAATEAAKHDNVEDRDQTYIAARAEAVSGMSLRDYFAAKACDKDVSDVIFENWQKHGGEEGYTAIDRRQARYLHADLMLAARSA